MKSLKYSIKKVIKTLTLLGLFLSICTFVIFFNSSGSLADNAKHYTELKFPPVPEISIPKYTRFTLKNGILVYLMEDHELPLVQGKVFFKTGSIFDPPNQVGLADLTGDAMRMGGTEIHSPDELNHLLEQRAASVETGIGETFGSATFNVLTEDSENVLDLFAEVVQKSAFASDQIQLLKKQAEGAIARQNDDPNQIASREFKKLIYGTESPYARTAELSTLKNISREDIVNFYEKYIRPENAILGIVGDFNTAKMRSLVEEKFGNWRAKTPSEIPSNPSVSVPLKSGIFAVNQSQLTQSSVQIGHLGGMYNSPDYAALSVLNDILNSFGGRLFNNIRTRQGLAYSVYGVWSARYNYPGIFVAGGQTRSETTVPFIQAIQKELERVRKEPITPEELAYSKESTLNSFIFNFEDPSQTLSRLMTYKYYDYPEDFIFQYRRQVEETTIADVQRVAEKYLHPDKMVTLVVGNVNSIKPSLASLSPSGEVKLIDITAKNPTPTSGNKP